nr:MAG TPA: major tail protein [Caudoviricetes sp.]
MSKEGRTGVTANTPKNILFGAGTIHKGLKYTTSAWNFTESLVGATSGGSKLSIIPEITKVEVDGALVPTKGLSVKTGETATMEINFIELTEDIIKASTIGKAGTSEDTNYSAIVSKADIEEGDYWENIAFVGKTLDGKNIIAILENALCTSGFEQEGKNKEGAVGKYTFETHAELNSDLDTLPWKIYYPKDT